MAAELLKILNNSIEKLDEWVSGNGWAGYDPYDIKGTPLFLKLLEPKKHRIGRVFQKMIGLPVVQFESWQPLLSRKLFKIKPDLNAKAMGLFACAYLYLFQATGKEGYRYRAIECLNWLKANPSAGYSYNCWGYPFDWQSKIFIPAGTPSSVVSNTVGHAFWIAGKILEDPEYFVICEDICRFFLTYLNRDKVSNEILCFSYTPIDHFHVHNANLFVAEFLLRVGQERGNPEFLDMGLKAGNYALSELQPDGSLRYWGRIDDGYNSPVGNDHYHIGFEIRALYSIWKMTGKGEYRDAYERYYRFYRKQMLISDGNLLAPKMNKDFFYPINIHSCAEAILLNATLAEDQPDAQNIVSLLAHWIIDKMQTNEGWFLYMIKQWCGIEIKIQIPYIRWGQAWMMLSLSKLLLTLKQLNTDNLKFE